MTKHSAAIHETPVTVATSVWFGGDMWYDSPDALERLDVEVTLSVSPRRASAQIIAVEPPLGARPGPAQLKRAIVRAVRPHLGLAAGAPITWSQGA